MRYVYPSRGRVTARQPDSNHTTFGTTGRVSSRQRRTFASTLSPLEPTGRRIGDGRADDGRVKLKLDLHNIYNRGEDIDHALRAIINQAIATKAPLVEIIPGKGSRALKKHVLRFLDQKEIKALYHRVEKDSDNFCRIFVHFRWK